MNTFHVGLELDCRVERDLAAFVLALMLLDPMGARFRPQIYMFQGDISPGILDSLLHIYILKIH